MHGKKKRGFDLVLAAASMLILLLAGSTPSLAQSTADVAVDADGRAADAEPLPMIDSPSSDAVSELLAGEDPEDPKPRHEKPKDDRDRLSAELVLGIAVDNFAAGELLNVLNPEDANESGERFVAGFGIDYRLSKRLWASVYTVHGVRSSEVDCSAATGGGEDTEGMMEEPAAPAVCSLGSLDPSSIAASESATYILKEATSFEGWLALRYEFPDLFRKDQKELGSPGNAIYLVGRAGLLSVQDSEDDVIDNHMFGAGVMITQDRFKGSFLEVGWGRTQLFGDNANDRWKARALLKWKLFKGDGLPGSFDALGAYVGIVVDTDGGGNGSDSVQSYFGFTFDVAALMGSGSDDEDEEEEDGDDADAGADPGDGDEDSDGE